MLPGAADRLLRTGVAAAHLDLVAIAWEGAGIVSVTIRFVQRCEATGPPL